MSLGAAVGLLIFIDELINFFPDSHALQSFIMGLFITIAIVLILFAYSYKTDRILMSHLRRHRLVAGRAKRSRRASKSRETRSMCAGIDRLVRECSLLGRMGDKYDGVPDLDRPQFRDDLRALHCIASRPASDLRHLLGNADYLGDRTCDDILAAIDLLKNAPPVDDNGMVDTEQYQEILDRLGSVQGRLERRLDLVTERSAVAPGSLVVCLDRDTYSPGAAIRATVKAGERFPDRKVTVTIFDEGLGKLAKKTETVPVPVQGRPAPTTIAVCMNTSPGKLDAGQEYIVRATCGDLHGEAVFVVEDIAPTVQAGAPTCTIGDNIAITIVDPAAAVGDVETGPSGTAGGQRLVLESPYGWIDASPHLMVEDHSAGTFCVRVECAGVRGCEGVEGAAVACGPNHLIRIKYESRAGEAWTAVLVEGPDVPSATDTGDTDPASVECGGGGDGPDRPAGGGDDNGDAGGDGDVRHDTETEQRGHKVGRAGRMPGGSEDGGGRRQ